MPKLVVVIPVYNGIRYLPATLDSLRAQTLRDFRVHIFDDGSDDGTTEYLRSLNDPRIRVTFQQRSGVTATRRAALEQVSEEFVAFLDADDLAMPERLERQLAYLESHPDTVLVGSQLRLIDEEGRALGERSYPVEHEDVVRMLPHSNCFAGPAVMFRRAAALEAGNVRLGTDGVEDYDLWLRMARLGKVCNLPAALTAYRLHTQQFKAKRTRLQLRQTIWARLQARRYGYRVGPGYWLTLGLQCALLGLPAGLIQRLFRLKLRLEAPPTRSAAAR